MMSWKKLLEGASGTVPLLEEAFQSSPSRVAGVVTRGSGEEEFDAKRLLDGTTLETGKLAEFSQFAVASAKEALHHANWFPTTDVERQATGVSMGSGIGTFEETVQVQSLLDKKQLRRVSPFFIPRTLSNIAAVSGTLALLKRAGANQCCVWASRAQPLRSHGLCDRRTLHRRRIPTHQARPC